MQAQAGGGAERYTIDLAQELVRRGHRVNLVTARAGTIPTGIGAIELTPAGITRASRYAAFLKLVDHHLIQERYDIVHAMLPVCGCNLYHPHAGLAAEAIRKGHLKHSKSLHRAAARVANQVNLKRQRFAAVEREMLVGANGPLVLCLSDLVKKTVREHYSIAENRLVTLFNAVDLSRFDPAANPAARRSIRDRHGIGVDKTVALMIAQDFQRKGLRQTIEAIALLKDPRLVLLVVGKQHAARYVELARTLGVSQQIIFAGGTTDPAGYYAASDFFVLPTHHDPCSLVVLESLAMGLPVISTVFNGACEIMRDGEHGFVLSDPSNIDQIAGSMKRLMDIKFRQKCAAACLNLRARLSFDEHVHNLEQIYQSIRPNQAR